MENFTTQKVIEGVLKRALEAVIIWGLFNFTIVPCFKIPPIDFLSCAGVILIYRTLKD